jgi:transcriptional regulator GlxA family with amidase domain
VVTAVGVPHTRIAEPWTLDLLIERVHLSRSCDVTSDRSPIAFLRTMRVERMARLMFSPDLSLSEVVRSTGWADAN